MYILTVPYTCTCTCVYTVCVYACMQWVYYV